MKPNVNKLIEIFLFSITARRRVAAKRKKLKNLGKSKSTDTEDEDADEDCGDEGEKDIYFHSNYESVSLLFLHTIFFYFKLN